MTITAEAPAAYCDATLSEDTTASQLPLRVPPTAPHRSLTPPQPRRQLPMVDADSSEGPKVPLAAGA
ncbi:hypothetical protein GCM10008994_19960 [Halorubrum ejinorense]|uniref:Uncharacterized protein n=1 Tax=Halorubrum ejinorense TaxID=425309 RepID=A0AAV3ST89_9EURY